MKKGRPFTGMKYIFFVLITVPAALLGTDQNYILPVKTQSKCSLWTGSDRIDYPGFYFSAWLALKTSGPGNGVLTVHTWTCPDKYSAKPEDCQDLISHRKIVITGVMTEKSGSVTFSGNRVVSYRTISGVPGDPEGYCPDHLAGPVKGNVFKATRTDGCTTPTTIHLTRQNCS